MKKINIRTNLVTGICMGVLSIIMLLILPMQVRLPMYDSGAPSPRIIPGICLVGILILSVVLIIESLVLKKEKILVFDWEKERPILILIAGLLVFVGLTMVAGFIPAGIVVFCAIQFFCGERKIPVYIYTVAAVVIVYFLFEYVFNVSLPGIGG
ncbi:MAG: tripartite tricarboxylate transporter TctB family protein [Treponema sp.]|nr:tripartite tricarboxylate transporter TctB family protein [Treponema sp.]